MTKLKTPIITVGDIWKWVVTCKDNLDGNPVALVFAMLHPMIPNNTTCLDTEYIKEFSSKSDWDKLLQFMSNEREAKAMVEAAKRLATMDTFGLGRDMEYGYTEPESRAASSEEGQEAIRQFFEKEENEMAVSAFLLWYASQNFRIGVITMKAVIREYLGPVASRKFEPAVGWLQIHMPQSFIMNSLTEKDQMSLMRWVINRTKDRDAVITASQFWEWYMDNTMVVVEAEAVRVLALFTRPFGVLPSEIALSDIALHMGDVWGQSLIHRIYADIRWVRETNLVDPIEYENKTAFVELFEDSSERLEGELLSMGYTDALCRSWTKEAQEAWFKTYIEYVKSAAKTV